MTKVQFPAYKATEKLLIAIRDGKSIPTAPTQDNIRTIARLVGYCDNDMMVPAVKEIRALAECSLPEAIELYKKYIKS